MAWTSYWVSVQPFTVRIDVDEQGVIRRGAPVVRWAINKPLSILLSWLKGKFGQYEIVEI